MHLKGTLKIALRRSIAHVVPLFLLRTIINVNQSHNGFERGLSESRRVFKKSAFLKRERGHFTLAWLAVDLVLSNNRPISSVIVSKDDLKCYWEFISRDKTASARGETAGCRVVKIALKIIRRVFISVFSLRKELINFSYKLHELRRLKKCWGFNFFVNLSTCVCCAFVKLRLRHILVTLRHQKRLASYTVRAAVLVNTQAHCPFRFAFQISDISFAVKCCLWCVARLNFEPLFAVEPLFDPRIYWVALFLFFGCCVILRR